VLESNLQLLSRACVDVDDETEVHVRILEPEPGNVHHADLYPSAAVLAQLHLGRRLLSEEGVAVLVHAHVVQVDPGVGVLIGIDVDKRWQKRRFVSKHFQTLPLPLAFKKLEIRAGRWRYQVTKIKNNKNVH
jgi:hypothetical protein